MIFLISIFSLVHVLFYASLAWRWKKIPVQSKVDRDLHFSIVIPVRNEEENIGQILEDLQNQDYSTHNFEVVVVDDFSTDNTFSMVQNFVAREGFVLKAVSLVGKDRQGKKQALTSGIAEAKYEIVITTDADCRIGKNWIRSFSNAFDDDVHIVAGPVALQGKGFFENLQKIEFSGLVAFGGVTLTANNPSMCSGANLGFRKEAFFEVGGYSGNMDIPSGDDEFMLYDIMKTYPRSGRFLKSREAIVKTNAHESFKAFLNQRARWVSKWKHNKNNKLRATAILFFLDYLIFLIGWIGVLIGKVDVTWMAVISVLRFVSGYLFLRVLGNFLSHSAVFWPLLLLQIFYPFHVLLMGTISIFGGYTWKGRRY